MRLLRTGVAALLLANLLLGGCVSWKATTGEPLVDEKAGYQVTMPLGWYQVPSVFLPSGKAFTRDGLTLQLIAIDQSPHKDAFPALEESSSADMLPEELAEKVIAELKLALSADTMQVLENRPTQLGGRTAVSMISEYRTDSGLRYRLQTVAATTDRGLYVLAYQAPTLRYFDLFRDDFNSALASFGFVDTE